MAVSPCEMYECDKCDHFAAAQCPGCQEGNRLLAQRRVDVCGIYRCAQEKNLATCGSCNLSACDFACHSDLICPLRAAFEGRRWWAGRISRHVSARKKEPGSAGADKVSERTIGRMRRYLMALEQFADQGADTISSWQLSERVGVKAALIRKDLSHFGGFGTPSAGYQVNYLKRQISDIMRLNETRGVIWLGAKKLREQSEAIATMTHHNRHLVAVLDCDPKEIGSRIMDVEVQHMEALHRTIEALAPDVAVIAIPDEDAQKAASILVRGGVNAILNLTSTLLVVPAHVNIRSIDISGELLALSYYSSRDSR